MSYILDALKKSEQQRDLGKIPTLTEVPSVSTAVPTRKNLPLQDSGGTETRYLEGQADRSTPLSFLAVLFFV